MEKKGEVKGDESREEVGPLAAFETNHQVTLFSYYTMLCTHTRRHTTYRQIGLSIKRNYDKMFLPF